MDVNPGDVVATEDENTVDDNSIVLGPFVCLNAERHNWSNLMAQELAAYCKPRYRFHGIRCAGIDCNNIFVEKNAGEGRFRPSSRTPMWHCKNVEDDCTYALCCHCYNKLSNTNKYKRTRSG